MLFADVCFLFFPSNDEFSDYYEILEHMDPFSLTYFSESEDSARPVINFKVRTRKLVIQRSCNYYIKMIRAAFSDLCHHRRLNWSGFLSHYV